MDQQNQQHRQISNPKSRDSSLYGLGDSSPSLRKTRTTLKPNLIHLSLLHVLMMPCVLFVYLNMKPEISYANYGKRKEVGGIYLFTVFLCIGVVITLAKIVCMNGSG